VVRNEGAHLAHQDDGTLIRAFLRTRNDDFFEELVRRHKDRAFRLAVAVLGPGSEADAEDVCQEVFVLVYRKLGDFRMESAFSTWLYRMTTNRGTVRPTLSLHFVRNPRQRVAAERADVERRRWRLLLMRSYWVIAAAASVWILLRVQWPSEPPPVLTLAVFAFVAALVVLPPMALLRSFRTSLFDLVLGTLSGFDQHTP